jgi:hypothetical protein
LILRPRELYDGATPSANSVAASNWLRLAAFTGEERHRRRAEEIFAASSGYLRRAPLALPRMLGALDFATSASREIVLSGVRGRADFEGLRDAVFDDAELNRVVAHADAEESLADVCPLVAGRGAAGDGKGARALALAYVCRDFACDLPVSSPAALAAALGRVHA